MYRESMQFLRAQTIEEQRQQHIYRIVSEIYMSAVGTARNTNETRYLYMVPEDGMTISEFHMTNMADILHGVQSLFPDCSVKHTKIAMAQTPDGVFIDVSRMDESHNIYMNSIRIWECIVVDWS
jgi:hypothetical protein